MLLFLALILAGCSVYLAAIIIIPMIEQRRMAWHSQTEQNLGREMDKLFYYDRSPKQIMLFYYILPPIFGFAGWFFMKHAAFALVGVVLGLLIPNTILKFRDYNRRKKFDDQLLDAILLLSSSLKGGLSLLQGLEVLVEEMPAPMNQEIGLVVRENKMGVNIEESLRNLNKRMYVEELNLVINSLLVARETGGDLIKVLSRLSTTIRDNRKLKDSIKTLTMQGRVQGVIMSVLPFIFVVYVLTQNSHHFDIMLQMDIGKWLLGGAIFLQLVGVILIKRFSAIKV